MKPPLLLSAVVLLALCGCDRQSVGEEYQAALKEAEALRVEAQEYQDLLAEANETAELEKQNRAWSVQYQRTSPTAGEQRTAQRRAERDAADSARLTQYQQSLVQHLADLKTQTDDSDRRIADLRKQLNQ